MRGINLATYLENTSVAHPDKVGLIFEDKKCMPIRMMPIEQTNLLLLLIY